MKVTRKVTAAELIEALQKQPPDALVALSDGDGYNSDLRFHCGDVYLNQSQLDESGDGEFYTDEVML